tara:strand:+ start:341 stop:544 length:204 start_codon:yes stop_codon:yes gene_type:complete
MIKLLVTVFSIVVAFILMILSMALTKDFTDPVTQERHVDKEGRLMGYIGYFGCFLILYGLYNYLFKN